MDHTSGLSIGIKGTSEGVACFEVRAIHTDPFVTYLNSCRYVQLDLNQFYVCIDVQTH